MTQIPFYMVGSVGLVKDVSDHELPPLAWSDGKNVQFRDGKITRRDGYLAVLNPPAVTPYWLMFAFTPTDSFWLYMSLTKAYATDGANHVDITRTVGGDYSTTDTRLWTGGILSGIPVITNGVDVPQSWSPVSLSQVLVNLPNWPGTVRAKIIKPYKNFLVALGVTKSSVYYPHLVKWSHPAVPGAVPSSWDETDPTKLAGEVEIGDEQPGEIQDALTLRDMLVIYKENTVHGMQFIGGSQVFRFFPILNNAGVLSTHCVASIKEGRAHIIATADDLVIFDGQNTESVLDERMKTWLENNLESAASNRAFVFAVPRTKEAWFCFPTTGQTWPNVALVWSWQENTLSLVDLPPNFTFATVGALSSTSDTWDTSVGTWDADATIWDVVNFRANFFQIVGTQIDPNTLLGLEQGQLAAGGEYRAFVQRTALAITGKDRISGQFKSDIGVRKLVSRIWIKARGSTFRVRMGGQEQIDGPITWLPYQSFNPVTDRFKDFMINTPLYSLEFDSETSGQWIIDGYDLELVPVGNL